jgi:hypothetical protein
MQAVLEIFLLAVGVPCIIVLIAAENAIVTLIVMIYAVLIALPTFLLATPLCVLLFIPCGRCGRGSLLNGMIRVLARTENHPEAWWYNTIYNVNLALLFSTCSNGYSRTCFVSRETGV